MKYAILFFSLLLSVFISGCGGQAFVRHSEARHGEIKEQKKLLIATNLAYYLGKENFYYLSSEFPKRLRAHGVEVKVIALTTPDALEVTDVRKEARGFGSDYVLTITKGNGLVEDGRLVRTDIFTSLADASSGRKLWGSRIDHFRGSIFSNEEGATSPLIETLVNELQRIGVVRKSGHSLEENSVANAAGVPIFLEKSVEARLKKLDELLERKIITKAEYDAKRKELIGGL